jgi:anaerobic selenocysteine-containing dehydrogenase
MWEGGGYDPKEPGDIGTLDQHGEVNVLTLDQGTSRLAQGCTANTALVEVEMFYGKDSSPSDFTAL